MLVVDVPQAHEKALCRQLVIANTPQFRLHRCAESVRAIGTLQNRHIGLRGSSSSKVAAKGFSSWSTYRCPTLSGRAVLQRRLA